MLIRTTQLADAVLALVDDYLGGSDMRVYVEPYKDGRERGWALSTFSDIQTSNMVAFAEFRMTSELVIYCGSREDFDMQGNKPSDEVYDMKVRVPRDQLAGAAQIIVGYLTSTHIRKGQ